MVSGVRIVHDDPDLVVVDKPPGVAAHPSLGWDGPSVVEHLAAAGFRISTSGAAERQGVVQRLDVGTSGLMVVAKSEYAYTVLKRAFRAREVHKVYQALVQGLPDPLVGTIDAPIGRHRGHDWKMAVVEGGRHSVTHYETPEARTAASLLPIHLETGRTHQIRVHMAAVRHPCVGDRAPGGMRLNERHVFVVRLGNAKPTGQGVEHRATARRKTELRRNDASLRRGSGHRRMLSPARHRGRPLWPSRSTSMAIA